MSERLNKILAYEKQLLKTREELQHLLTESSEDDSALFRDKLDFMSVELKHLEKQITLLKQEAAGRQTTLEAAQPALSQAVTVSQPMPAPVNEPSAEISSIAAASPAVAPPSARPAPPSMVQKQAPVKSFSKDLEQTIGKSIMGIFASVLIFISLILFATLLLPYFNDTAKMITTYVVSFGFIGAGLYKLRKDKENRFYIALTGCGVGALYISLLLSNLYFKALGDITLYILIALWAAGVCFLSPIKNMLFEIIGHLGILIAVIFGCIHCHLNDDTTKFTILLFFYLAAAVVFYITHCKREQEHNIVFHCFNVVNLGILSFSALIFTPEIYFACGITSVFAAASVALMLWTASEESSGGFTVFTSIYLLLFLFSFSAFDDLSPLICGLVIYLIFGSLVAVMEWHPRMNPACRYIPQVILVCSAMVGVYCMNILGGYSALLLVVLPVLILGFIRNHTLFKYLPFVLVYWILDEYTQTLPLVLCIYAMAALVYLFIYRFRQQYNATYKYIAYVLTLLLLACTLRDVLTECIRWLPDPTLHSELKDVLCYTLFAALNIGMQKSCFSRNLQTGARENPALYNIVNAIQMLVGIVYIGCTDTLFLHIWIILATLVVFLLNSKNLLDKRDNILWGIYVGIKFAVLIYFILDSFDTTNYYVSIIFFVFAICCIILGFRFNYKSLRIFGLALSMISTFKLIMVDITYTNTLGHALSFFVSGILCFAISMIYNYIDKKIHHEISA